MGLSLRTFLLSLMLASVVLSGGCAKPGPHFHEYAALMQEQPNLESVKEIYAGFAAGDLDSILGKMDEGVVWEHPGSDMDIPFAGRFEGKAGVLRFFETAMKAIDVLEQRVNGYLAQGDVVAVLGYEHMRVKRNGHEYRSNWVHLYTFSAGKIVRFEEFIDTAVMQRAFSATN